MTTDIATTQVFGLTAAEFAVLLAGGGYVISLARDWRPIRTVRAENRELRDLCEAIEKKNVALEAQIVTLKQATDLTVIVDTLDRLDGAVRANSAVLEVLGRASELKRQLEG